MDDDRFLEQLTTLDTSGDGRITISDLWEWISQLAVMPGDVIIYLLVSHMPPIAGFLELRTSDYGGAFSHFLSIASWLVLFVAANLAFNGIRRFDRALTARVVASFAELMRMLRVARRRVVTTVVLWRRRQEASRPLEIEAVELASLERAVLKCYASVDDLIVLTPRDISKRLGLSKNQVEHAIRRLGELSLVERSFGTDESEEGHHISQAGQMYLINS